MKGFFGPNPVGKIGFVIAKKVFRVQPNHHRLIHLG
jgi:hypothetical protein